MKRVSCLCLAFVLLTSIFIGLAGAQDSISHSSNEYIYAEKLPDIEFLSPNAVEQPSFAEAPNLPYAPTDSGKFQTSAYIFTNNTMDSNTQQQIDSQVDRLKLSGYSCNKFIHSLTPSKICEWLPILNNLVILHGHGSVGSLNVYSGTSNKYSILYSTNAKLGTGDACLMDLDSIPAKIMIFTSCHSASTNSTCTVSLASAGYLKGADVTLGYTISVAGGEWYSKIVTWYLADGEDFGTAVQEADKNFSSICTVLDAESPAFSNHRLIFGSKSITLG